jgi:hypothetical protein
MDVRCRRLRIYRENQPAIPHRSRRWHYPRINFRINDVDALEDYLKASTGLYQAYLEEFGISEINHISLSIDSDHSRSHFDKLKRWSQFGDSWDNFYESRALDEMRAALKPYWSSLLFNDQVNLVGVMFFNMVFSGWLKINDISLDADPDTIKRQSEKFYSTIAGELHPLEPSTVRPLSRFRKRLG